MGHSEPGGHWFVKKNLKLKILRQTPFRSWSCTIKNKVSTKEKDWIPKMGLKLANLRLHLLLTRQKKPFPSNTLKSQAHERCFGEKMLERGSREEEGLK